MVKGRTGMALEGWKFGIYLGIPLLASWWYGDPERQKAAAEYWQYVKYPPNPTVGMKEKFIEQRQKYEEQRKVYSEQLKKLDDLAGSENDHKKDLQQNRGFWWKLAFWSKQE
mmetsp:Transcript_19902/g.25631  ORF Transcript_19902/g.25631 Transcript_19902/m.25631 type:complete len:112 (-) Transcript_19902:290-625(-)|eukprot:CAMPEP_0198143384 /NCGR_PEP_ID=MMETSP1443-20131203/6974_1 /TAXON_ID=186043 /ORGANISM="Entomoneis sp., Strain CCMP2396" /LENGTH=111 /DNA_ID=CAMNT_0043806613 /DNA_START=158 /DNA_END=493 /DNA_ORIENTATION=+